MEQNQELKEIAQKVAKSNRICIEIDENLKTDLEFVQFYFYRDTSKKITKKMIEDMINEKLADMKKKIAQEIGN